MGEEEKKTEEVKKKPEEEMKKEEQPPKADEKPSEEKKSEESKEAAPPSPQPQEIVLKVFMHCEGCATKVRRCLRGFEGVEDVTTDCKTSKVIVKGEKADPIKVLERVQRKSHRQVELLSPIPQPPPPPPEEPKKPEEKEVAKAEEKKPEPVVITVVLQVNMHCEACAQEIRKRIQKMKGVESAEPDLKSSQVIVRGVFEPENLVDFVYKKTGKLGVIVKVDPEKKGDEKEKEKVENKDEKKTEDGGKEVKKSSEEGKEKKEGDGDGGASNAATGGGEQPPTKPAEPEVDTKLELKKNEMYNYYPQHYQVQPQRYVQEYDGYAPQVDGYAPQIFSDENPNACSVM